MSSILDCYYYPKKNWATTIADTVLALAIKACDAQDAEIRKIVPTWDRFMTTADGRAFISNIPVDPDVVYLV